MTSPTTDIVAPWSLGGYAPGSYMCICVSCDKAHEADKRSTQCIDCAAREAAALISSLVAERDAAQRDAQIAQGFFAIEADKHSEWLENYMVMKAQAETAERLLAEARTALTDCATIMPRYRLAGKNTGEDEEFSAVLERVNEALGAKP